MKGTQPCSIDGCAKLTRSRTAALCNMHYERQRRFGTTDDPRSLENRLWRSIEFADCWTWTRGLNAEGYGQIMENGKNMRVHRLVYELLVGAVPDGLVLDHLCRVRSCCNPDHLEPVTQKTNMRRSSIATAIRSGRCHKGHSLEDGYTFPSTGDRKVCRTCTQARNQRRSRT